MHSNQIHKTINLDIRSVLRELTNVLLDQRFLEQLVNVPEPEQIMLTPEQMRVLMADIACSSLMRLDKISMDKLWDLMVTVYKWQLTVAQNDPHRLLNVSFKHLDGVSRLMPEMLKTILVDAAKLKILNSWDNSTEDGKRETLNAISEWLKPFMTKISILMRLGLQDNNSQFVEINPGGPLRKFMVNVGENIYRKNPKKTEITASESSSSSHTSDFGPRELYDDLAEQLQISTISEEETAAVKESSSDLIIPDVRERGKPVTGHEFVQIQTTHSRAEVPLNLKNCNLQDDLMEIMKIQPYFSKY